MGKIITLILLIVISTNSFAGYMDQQCLSSTAEQMKKYEKTNLYRKPKQDISNQGLYYYSYRVYDPTAGRWTQRDPIDYQDSINLYQFCGNNPVNNIDPFGLKDRKPDKNTKKPEVKEKGTNTKATDLDKEAKKFYNCYSAALFGKKGDGSNKDMPRYASEESAKKTLKNNYTRLDDNKNNKKGDVVAYYEGDKLVHAGIVTEVDKDGYTTQVESKFGAGPLILHHPRQTKDPTTGNTHYNNTTRVYFRAK